MISGWQGTAGQAARDEDAVEAEGGLRVRGVRMRESAIGRLAALARGPPAQLDAILRGWATGWQFPAPNGQSVGLRANCTRGAVVQGAEIGGELRRGAFRAIRASRPGPGMIGRHDNLES